MKKIMMLFLAALLSFPITAHASESVPNDKAYIRAKLRYECEDDSINLSDDLIDFVDGWTKKGEWYYWKDPVKLGDKVRFITAVNIPETWSNEQANKHFQIIASVEASEIPLDGSAVITENMVSSWTKLTVTAREYQVDSSGREVAYVNDKLVMPGDVISKIIEFEIGGEQAGENPSEDRPTENDKPSGSDKTNNGSKLDTVSDKTNDNTKTDNKTETGKTPVKDAVQNTVEVIKTGQETYLLAAVLGLMLLAGGAWILVRRKK